MSMGVLFIDERLCGNESNHRRQTLGDYCLFQGVSQVVTTLLSPFFEFYFGKLQCRGNQHSTGWRRVVMISFSSRDF